MFLTVKYTKNGVYLLVGLWFIRIAILDYHDLIFGANSIVPSNSLAYLLPFAALPCLAMGYMVKKYEDKFLSYSYWGTIAVTATVFFYLNEFVLSQISHTLSTILKPVPFTTVIISVFVYALQHKTMKINSSIQYIGQHLSGNIYYFHGAVIFLLNTSYGYESFGSMYVFVSSVLVAYVVVAIQKYLNINIFR